MLLLGGYSGRVGASIVSESTESPKVVQPLPSVSYIEIMH